MTTSCYDDVAVTDAPTGISPMPAEDREKIQKLQKNTHAKLKTKSRKKEQNAW